MAKTTFEEMGGTYTLQGDYTARCKAVRNRVTEIANQEIIYKHTGERYLLSSVLILI